MRDVLVSYKKIFNSNNAYDGSLVKEYISKLKEVENYSPLLESFVLVTNTSKQSYEFIGDNFEKTLGLDSDRMLKEGLPYYISHYHPDELPILLKIFEDLMVFTMSSLSLEQRKRVVYTWNYRIKNTKGEYKNMYVQQTPIFFDESGRPIIGYSLNSIVGEGKQKPLIASCKYLNAKQEFETIFSKNYLSESFKSLLSKREIEVTKLLSKGKTSKEIAKKLFISHQTVSVHRRNILKKLELNTTSDIIKYCSQYEVF